MTPCIEDEHNKQCCYKISVIFKRKDVRSLYRIIELKDVGLPSKKIIMVIPGFVKNGQRFQIFECTLR